MSSDFQGGFASCTEVLDVASELLVRGSPQPASEHRSRSPGGVRSPGGEPDQPNQPEQRESSGERDPEGPEREACTHWSVWSSTFALSQ